MKYYMTLKKELARKVSFFCAVALITALLSGSVRAHADEGGAVSPGSVVLPTVAEEYVSVLLPTIGEESPFDFHIDPQGLIYETDAALHGGGTVEEGAYILFRNHDGKYDFSKYSDKLKVINQSTVPVNVTITASVVDLGEAKLTENSDFSGSDECSMYLAIVDDEGNEQSISGDGEVSVQIELKKAPEDTYILSYDEETGNCKYELAVASGMDFDSYSFGLVGYCNPEGAWEEISVSPKVNVTWRVEPVLLERDIDLEDAAHENATAPPEEVKEEIPEEIILEEEAFEEIKDESTEAEAVDPGKGQEADTGERENGEDSETAADRIDAEQEDTKEDISDTEVEEGENL